MQLPIVTSFIIRLARPRECKWDWIASISRGNLSCCIKVTIHQGPILPECIQQGNPEMDSIRSSSNGACEVAWEIQHRIFSAFECFNLSEQFCCVTKKKNGCCRPVSKMIEVKWFCAYCIKASCLRVRKQQITKADMKWHFMYSVLELGAITFWVVNTTSVGWSNSRLFLWILQAFNWLFWQDETVQQFYFHTLSVKEILGLICWEVELDQ